MRRCSVFDLSVPLSILLMMMGENTFTVGLTAETQLFRRLFNASGYTSAVRPIKNPRKAIKVHLQFELVTVAGLSEVDQVLTTVGFIVAKWKDELLTWEPKDHGGINKLVVPARYVWLPDIVVANSANTFYQETFFRDFRVEVTNKGEVMWMVGGNFQTSCTLDMTYYPFDIQMCELEVENIAYSSDQVDLRNATHKIHKQDYSEHGEWALHHTSVERELYREEDIHPDKEFPRVRFFIILRRKPLYYFLNIVTPCCFCIFIALMVFWLPPESGEKVSLGITVLLAFSVFQLVVADNTPKTSDFTPLLSILMSAIMAMATLSVLTSILVLYIYHHSTNKRAPACMRVFAFRFLAKIMCMSAMVPKDNKLKRESEEPTILMDRTDEHSVNGDLWKPHPRHHDSSEIRQILNHLTFLVDHIKHKDKDALIEDEWKAMAMVLDRVFFWVTTLLASVVIPIFLVQRDHRGHH